MSVKQVHPERLGILAESPDCADCVRLDRAHGEDYSVCSIRIRVYKDKKTFQRCSAVPAFFVENRGSVIIEVAVRGHETEGRFYGLCPLLPRGTSFPTAKAGDGDR
eukprot:764578-Amphidinium_carterae.1